MRRYTYQPAISYQQEGVRRSRDKKTVYIIITEQDFLSLQTASEKQTAMEEMEFSIYIQKSIYT